MALIVGTNSYVTVLEADEYLADRLYKESWLLLDETTKEKALISALDLQENLCAWDGVPTDEDQALSFPVDEETEVPDDIKASQIEIAFEMTDQEIATYSPESEELSQLKAGSVSLTFFESLNDPFTVVNSTAKGKLRKYGSCSFGTNSAYTIPVSR